MQERREEFIDISNRAILNSIGVRSVEFPRLHRAAATTGSVLLRAANLYRAAILMHRPEYGPDVYDPDPIVSRKVGGVVLMGGAVVISVAAGVEVAQFASEVFIQTIVEPLDSLSRASVSAQ